METILIILSILSGFLLLCLLIMVVFYIKKSPKSSDIELKSRNQQELISKIDHLSINLSKEVELINNRSNSEFKNELNQFKEVLSTKVNFDMNQINDKVEKRLSDGFKSTSEIFNDIAKRLIIIDEAQKNIEKVSHNIDELSSLLSDKKQRGLYGEAQLYNILNNVFGENNKVLFEQQKKLSNQTMVDAVIHGPSGIGMIGIDSKFSLENYILMNDDKASMDVKNQATKDFKLNIKKHIDDIASKYIIVGETADQAIMFIPSESIFTEINAKHADLIQYAIKKHVWITSPTTLVYMLMMILVLSSNVLREKNSAMMIKELQALFEDFKRLFSRFEELKSSVKKLNTSVESLEIPMHKLDKKVFKIKNSEFDELVDREDVD